MHTCTRLDRKPISESSPACLASAYTVYVYTLLSALRKRHVKKLRQAKRGAGRKKTTRPRRKRGGATYTRVWQRIVPPREARENGGFLSSPPVDRGRWGRPTQNSALGLSLNRIGPSLILRVGLSLNLRGWVYLASARSHVPNNLFGSDLGIGNNGWNPPPIEHTLLLPVRVPACGGRVKSEWCTRSGRPYLVRTA